MIDAPASTRRSRITALAIVAATVIAYLPAINGRFIWDDDDYLTENRLVTAPGGLPGIWRPGTTRQYYPVVFTSFWIEYRLWGLAPLGYHLDNVLLHAAAALLLWRLLRTLGVPGAALTAAVFALHPVHVESVAWITERKNTLSGCFYLLAALAYLRSGGARPAPPPQAWGLSLALFILALLSKSVTCSLPAALVLAMFLQGRRLGAAALLPLVPFLAAGLAAALYTAHLEQVNVGATGAEFDMSWLARGLLALRALVFYPWKLLVPWPLMFIYPRWTVDPRALASWWPLLPVVLAAAAAIVAARRGHRGPLVALAFYAGTIVPALGFFNVYPQQFSFVADHFQYLASAGIIALLVSAATRLPLRGRAAVLAAAAVLAVLAGLTWSRAVTFRSAETVWRDTLARNDHAWLAHNNLATILLRRAEHLTAAGPAEAAATAAREAEAHARRAAELRPDSALAQANLSEALRLEGRPRQALAAQQEAIAIVREQARAAGAAKLPAFLALNEYQLGRLHQLLGEPAEAAAAYRRSLGIGPARAPVRRDLATVLIALGRLEEARAQERQIVAAHPDDFDALLALAALAERLGDAAAADAWQRRALRAARSPLQTVQAMTRRIRFLTASPDPAYRDLPAAVALAEQLAGLSRRRDPAALDVLASVYAAAGRRAEAEATARHALAIARAAGMEELARRIKEHLDSYRR